MANFSILIVNTNKFQTLNPTNFISSLVSQHEADP